MGFNYEKPTDQCTETKAAYLVIEMVCTECFLVEAGGENIVSPLDSTGELS